MEGDEISSAAFEVEAYASKKKAVKNDKGTPTSSSPVARLFSRLKSKADRPSSPVQKKPKYDRLKSVSAGGALQGLRFIAESAEKDPKASLEFAEQRFDKLSVNGKISRKDFGHCIGMDKTSEFAEALFEALISKRSGPKTETISKEELRELWLQITNQDFDSRMEIFFQMCDKNSDGLISEEEIKDVIIMSASANRLAKLRERAGEFAALLMEYIDRDNNGYIELSEFKALMHPTSTDACLSYEKGLAPNHPRTKRIKKHVKSFIIWEGYKRMLWIMLWLGSMAVLFAYKFLQYRDKAAFEVMGYCVCAAKGAAETLKLNMALILLPVCRNLITQLRSTRLHNIVPFNDNINFHMLIAGGIAAGTIIHAGVHLACDFPRLVTCPDDKFYRTIASDFNFKKPTYGELVISIEGVTGVLLLVLMFFIFVLASHWSRRSLVKLPGPFHRFVGFNAFWYSHHLLVLVYILLIIHSIFLFLSHGWRKKTTWMYLAVPVLLYAVERVVRIFRSLYKVRVLEAAIHPGNVLALHISKPSQFKYKSGMYLFLKCPAISHLQWHPFSITSSPSDDFLSIHVRDAGDWTKELLNKFSKICKSPQALPRSKSFVKESPLVRFPLLEIDGPYGAPAQDYMKYDVVLLIGLGIGATPFISILKDILNQINSSNEDMEHQNQNKKAYFYWAIQDQGSFEWFKGVMIEIAEIDTKHIIEMHNYLTSVYEEGDARSALITLIQTLNLAKNGIDVLSGVQVRTHFARPKWKEVFSTLSNVHREANVGVFYCGRADVARELQQLCETYTESSPTNFDFHKENF